MIEGWTRVCPDCGSEDGDKVSRIAFHPTFRCDCGYIWDGSRATLLFLVPGALLFEPGASGADAAGSAQDEST